MQFWVRGLDTVLQGVLWGKVGDCIDAFELSEWIGMTSEGLKRARNLQEFSLDR